MTTDSPVKLVWMPFDDEHGNQAWQAESAIYQAGTPYLANYYLYQRLRHNQIEWCVDYDLSIYQPDAGSKTWPSLEAAQADIQALEYRLAAVVDPVIDVGDAAAEVAL